MRRKSLKSATCPIARSLDEIGDWWSLLIVRDAMTGKRRFGEFQRSLGLAKNILSARLQKLVKHKILALVPASDGTAYSEYALTEKGKSLYVVMLALWQWGEHSLFPPGRIGGTVIDRRNEQKIPPMKPRASDGRLLGAGDLRLVLN